MAGERSTNAIISTKLYLPRVESNHVHRAHLIERLDQRRQRPLTLVSAPAGYGKTTLVCCWLEASGSPCAWISLDEDDNDLHLFLNYLLKAVQTIWPAAGRKTLDMMNGLTLPPFSVLTGSLINDLFLIERPFLLVLDDFHLIKDDSVLDLISQLLRHPPQAMHLVLIGRRDPPLPISTLRARSLVTEIRIQDLRFRKSEIETFLIKQAGIQIDSVTIAALEEKTEGWVTGLRLAALAMSRQGQLDPKLLEPQVDANYVLEYLFDEVLSHHPPEVRQYLLGSAVLDRFCGPLCEAVCMPGAEPFTCDYGGWEFLTWLKKENLFVIPLDPENRWFRYHHLFQKLLINQLKRSHSADEVKSIHARAGAWYFENGHLEEALRHTLAAGNKELAGNLIARFSHQLINNQQWVRLKRCLYLLDHDQIEQDPALLVLEAWIHMVGHNFSGMADCVEKIEILIAASPPGSFVNLEYVKGQIDAFKASVYYMAAEGENALACARRSPKQVPSHHKRSHLLAHTAQILSYQMVGDLETGLSLYRKAMKRYINRDKNYHAMFLSKLGLIHWVAADLNALQQTAVSILNIAGEASSSAISPYYWRYFMGIIHYHRNELQSAEEKLAEVVAAHYAASPINFAHSAFALALTYQVQRKTEQAIEISRSVAIDAIETNNEDMLQVSRAFESELALRQGRLAEASQWLETYHTKPFLPAFRFYMPQITAARVLIAQDTTDSRRRAVHLLDQLHDFLVSIHNNRFRIDVLALQALLQHSQKNEPAALKALAEALTLAEPSGFIRNFADLGPRLVELLQQLIKQNVAVGYIMRILAAFKEDEHREMLDASDPNGQALQNRFSSSSSNSAFRIPNSDFHTTQPLVDPLTNREIDIQDLVAERLQNKEIAEKLHISPETVKKHLNNIYGKLSVSERRQAVDKARKLGILKS